MRQVGYFLSGVAMAGSAVVALAQAEGGAGNEFRIEEVIVTAQRREERLQDVPVAVTALSTEMLSQANVQTALDIGKVASGVILQPNATAVTAFVRGMGNNQTTVGNEASNALYIDGIYYTRIAPALLRLNNIERVEVLKGPQGTLFGRNATGGLINIITAEPQPGSAPEGKLSVGYAKYDTYEVSGYFAGSLSDSVAANISVYNQEQGDGWGKNYYDGSDMFTTDEFMVRGKLVFEPGDKTKFTLAADYNKAESNSIGSPGRFYGEKPTLTGIPFTANSVPDLPSRYDNNTNIEDRADTDGVGGFGRIEQEMSFATVITTLAYHEETSDFQADLDGTPLDSFQFSGLGAFSEQWSGEVQLQSNPDSPFDWTVGFFHLDQDFGYDQPARIFGEGLVAPGLSGMLRIDDGGQNKSNALYGQASFDITTQLRGTLGLRYTEDETSAFGNDDFLIGGFVVADAPLMEAETDYNEVTWRAALDYKPSDDLLLYGSISRGTKAGNFAIVTFDATPIDPEILDAYEIGFKSTVLDGIAQLNGAVFFYDIQDPQVQIQDNNSGVTRLVNAGGAEVKGAEMELLVYPVDNLQVRASATYLDSEYTDYDNAPFFVPNLTPPYGYLPAVAGDAKGNKLSRAPEFSANIGFTYTVPMADSNALEFSGNYAWTGKFYWNPDNLVDQPGYGLLDAQIAYLMNDDKLRLELWGSNLTDEEYNVANQQFGNFLGTLGNPGAPRTYGARASYSF